MILTIVLSAEIFFLIDIFLSNTSLINDNFILHFNLQSF